MTVEALHWIPVDNDGAPFAFHDPAAGIWVRERGISGRGVPPVELTAEAVAGMSGERLRNVRHGSREVAFPLTVVADTTTDLRARVHDLASQIDALKGSGTLRRTYDGVARDLTAIYAGGLEFVEAEDADAIGRRHATAVLVFKAHDPYWRSAVDSSVAWSSIAPDDFFPILPLVLAADTVLGTQEIVVDGDLPTWPRWTILGPGTDIEIANEDTGEILGWSGTLISGDVLEIDTTPGVKTVRLNGGSVFESLTAWELWALRPGSQTVTVTVSGSSDETSVTAYWRPTFLTAY